MPKSHKKKKGRKNKQSKFPPDTLVWYYSGDENVGWLQGKFVVELVGKYKIRVDGKLVEVPSTTELFQVDEVGLKDTKHLTDLVSLKPPNERNILEALAQRSVKYDMPYTFVGPVLICVNPINEVKEPKKGADRMPHPHRIAEAAVKQMQFASMVKQPLDQSIIVSGESGAGKTEASKRVLKRLVSGKGAVSSDKKSKSKSLDERLIDTNPILEAFGNATTLRNRNSSRFGKFMKLNVPKGSGTINGARIETYLLERSRVSGFVTGECNYHVFYQLVGGVAKQAPKVAAKLNLDVGGKNGTNFLYLQSMEEKSTRMGSVDSHSSSRPDKRDVSDFGNLVKALSDVGIGSKVQTEIFMIISGILNIGNVRITDGTQGAEVDKSSSSGKALDAASSQFGVKSGDLAKVICEQEMKVMGEVVASTLNESDARKSRDAIAKQMYSNLFDYIVREVNGDLQPSKSSDKDAFIGVLDIFGFETFKYNDLEQLLINYTNEALHGIFLQKVFDAELSLYRQEGLVPDNLESEISVPENHHTLVLLNGLTHPKIDGILDVIVQQSKAPGATDIRMVKELHTKFGHNTDQFPKPHPKDIDHMFKVKHFPGVVNYHIGNFLSKNHDRLPNLVESLFRSSKMQVVKDMWSSSSSHEEDGKENSKQSSSAAHSSIVHKFKGQIQSLSKTLSASQCSFIRCIKPNQFLEREPNSDDWFHSDYVAAQLVSLGIEPTVQVLSRGMPNRIGYSELIATYKSLLPSSSLKLWKKLGEDERAFVGALFWAFGIDPNQYKLGFSYAFFKSGDLEKLEEVLKSSSKELSKSKKKKLDKDFRWFLVRGKWRVFFAKMRVFYRFNRILLDRAARTEEEQAKAVVTVQRLARGVLARMHVASLRDAIEDEKREKAMSKAKEAMSKKEKSDKLAEKTRKKREKLKNSKGGLGRLAEALESTADLVYQETLQEGNTKNAAKALKQLEKDRKKKVKQLRKLEDKLGADVMEILDGDMDKGAFMATLAMKMKKKKISDEEQDKMLQDFNNQQLLKKHARVLKQEIEAIDNAIAEKKEFVSTGEKQVSKIKKERKVHEAKVKRMSRSSQFADISEILEATKESALAEADLNSAEQEARGLIDDTEAMAERNRAHREKQVREASRKARTASAELARQKRAAPKRKLKGAGLHGALDDMLANLGREDLEYFWASKLARKSQRNWKKRYFILNKSTHRLAYYKRKSSRSHKGEYYRGIFKMTQQTLVQPHRDIKKMGHVVQIRDPQDGDLFLSFRSPFEKIQFIDEMKKLKKKPARAAAKDSKKDKRKSKLMKVVSRRFGVKDEDGEEDDEYAKLKQGLEFDRAMRDLYHTLQTGQISEDEFNAIVDDMTFEASQPPPKEETNHESEESDEEVPTVIRCNFCDAVNDSGKLHCRKCNAEL